jgi:hypothetical protein
LKKSWKKNSGSAVEKIWKNSTEGIGNNFGGKKKKNKVLKAQSVWKVF